MEDYSKIISDLQKHIIQVEKKLMDYKDIENELNQTVKRLQQIEFQHNESQRITKIGHYIYNIFLDQWSNSLELDRIFGIDQNFERTSDNWIQIIHPDDRKMMEDHLKIDVIKNHERFNKEYKIINQKSGEVFWVHGIGDLKINEQGHSEKMFGTIQDITERKNIEINLNFSEEKFRKAFLTSPDSININRISDGLYVSVNNGFTQITGYTSDDVIGKTSVELNIWDDPEDRMKLVEGLKTKGTVENLEAKFKTKSGEIIYGLMSASIIELEGVPHSINITRDITTRKKAQLALAENERKLNNLFNNLQEIVYQCKIDEDWTMEFISTGFETMTGFKCSDVINNNKFSFNDLIVPDDQERVFKEAKEAVNTQNIFEIKYRLKTASGKIKHVIDRSVVNLLNSKDGSIHLEGFIIDITQQVEADEALRESETRFKNLVELLPETIFETDINFRLTYVNKRAYEISGYNEEDISKGINGMKIIAPEDRERAQHNYLKRFQGENIGPVKYNAIKKDGTIFQILFHADSILRNGQLVGLRGIIVDISDRVKMENALREGEQKLRLIFNNSPFGISTTDLDGHFVDVNPALSNIIGYSKEEMLGKHFNAFSHPDDKEKNRIKFHDLIDGEIPFFELEKRYIHKNGNIIYVLIRSQLIHDHEGNPMFQTAMIEDITERKKTEQIQRVLYNISNAAVSTGDLENLIRIIQKELGTIIDTTNFFVALYDEETEKITLPFFADEKDNHSFFPKGKSLTQYVIETKKSLLANINVKKKLVEEGKLEHIGSVSKIWLGVPLKSEGKVTGVLALQSYKDENAFNESDVKMLEFVSDQISISIQRKKADTELKTALLKANESDKLKSSFLATISHELRTPLNAIIGFSEFLDKQLDHDDVEKFGQIINSSGLHLLSIVNDLFDITLIEAGETKILSGEVNLNSILHEVSTVVYSNTDGNFNNIKFEIIVPDHHQNYNIITDANKLKQILINLLKNALKFTSEGFIHLGYFFISENNNPFIQFFVKDSGIGISKDKQDFIFDIFRQVDESNARRYGGAGIGLSVAKRLTELLGGRIWLESEPEKGSCFYFTIPAERIEESILSTKILKGITTNLEEILILIAEDDEASFAYLKTVLNKNGISSIRAKNGKEAVDLCFSENNIDLVLMDINMPIMNGYIATQKIKEFLPEMPIIAQTAYAVAGDREKIFESGCDEYISKPIKADELLAKIEQFIAKKKN